MPTVTRHFVNRTEELERLNIALNYEGPEKDSLVLVYGQTGIGKTQLLAKYLRECNYKGIRIAHVDLVDLVTKGYLGLIEGIMEGLGNDGFEDLDETFDEILIQSQIEKSKAFVEYAQKQLPVHALGQPQGLTFFGPVTAQTQTFVSGNVTYNNPKIENIYHIHLAEPEQVAALIQNRITRVFRSCLQNIANEQLVVVLLDHWEKASKLLETWLDAYLLRWASELTLQKALVVLSRETIPSELEDQMGILPLAVSPLSREAALEFWKKNGLAEEEFNTIGIESYSIPSILRLEVGKRSFRQPKT
jgi:hypothetical protein